MDTVWDKSLNQDLIRRQYQRENPSFSSTLLDAIYRSIDESNNKEEEQDMVLCRETMKKKHSNGSDKGNSRACMIEKWIEEKHTYEKKVPIRRKSMPEKDSHNHLHYHYRQQPVLLNSSSSSSESSCGGGFSSSESDSIHTTQIQKPKPIRTSVSVQSDRYQTGGEHNKIHCYNDQYATNCAPKHESGSFVKTKSKALKIYRDLKKVKQPISPGGRLATFLNSLFSTAGNAKKAKISSQDERKLKSEQNSTCSSASSFSRSCLSKTPSSNSKLNNGNKRSVRFYPVSVIVGEDSRPCGHKNVYENANQEKSTLIGRNSTPNSAPNSNSNSNSNSIHQELKFRVMSESRRVEEVARDLLKNYQRKNQEEEEEDDDAESCASSDLFELDNLSAIGIQRYSEELPVYETTHLTSNRAIASGLIL